jgi:hypothetical protein
VSILTPDSANNQILSGYNSNMSCTAFVENRKFACGEPAEVAVKVGEVLAADPGARVLVFDDETSELVDFDAPARKPGRPKLGVVAREVTLLPRHWEWLAGQPGGASVALRKLVEHARKTNAGADRRRQAQEAAYRFLSAMAGDEPGFEEATRALFASRREEFEANIAGWPEDVRDHARKLWRAIGE